MNYVVCAEVNQTGFIIGSYTTSRMAEKEYKAVLKLRDKYKYQYNEMGNLVNDLAFYRRFEIRNQYGLFLFSETVPPYMGVCNGVFTALIFKTKDGETFIDTMIKTLEFQSTLFPVDMLEKMNVNRI